MGRPPAALDIFGAVVTVRLGRRYYRASKYWLYWAHRKYSNIIFVADLLEHTSWYNSLANNWETLLSVQLKLPKGTEKIREMSRKIQEFYFGDKAVSKETWPQLVDVSKKMHLFSVFMSSYHRRECNLIFLF